MKKFYNLIVAIFLMATVVVAFPTGSVRAQGGEPLPSPQPPSFRPTLELNIPGLPEGYTQIRPVAGGVITGRYYQPYLEFGSEPHHTGVDFGIACGSPVRSVADGWVILSRDGWKAFSGGVVAVYHGYDPNTKLPWLTWYIHLATLKVEAGQKVTSGQKVGTVGTAGSGCHLHWAASNKLPRDFAGWYEHASERKDKLGWVDPLRPPQYLIKAPLPPGEIKPGIGDEDPVLPPTDPGDNSDSNVGLIATLDKIADAIRIVPGLKIYAELWDKYKEYLPWVSAILVVLLVLTVFRPFLGWLGKTRWGRRRDRKKKQFFWLWLLILLVYLYRRDQGMEDLLLLEMFKYAFGIWAFFVLSGVLYRIWRHFNFDAEIEKVLKAGGVDRWEGLREVIIAPVIYGVLVLILAWTFGYFWGGSQIDANEPPIPVSPPVEDPVAPLPVPPPPSRDPISFDCNFNAVKAGLGPVKVGCDENNLPTFKIRWWNGNYFNFQIPLRIWNAATGAGSTPEQIIGVIVFGSAESTGFTNYQSENEAGAMGVFQFLPGTFKHWAPQGFKDPKYRTDTNIAAIAVRNMQENGMKQIYAMRDMHKYISCFQGGGGCNTWNHHQAQAEYAWRLTVALRVAAGIK